VTGAWGRWGGRPGGGYAGVVTNGRVPVPMLETLVQQGIEGGVPPSAVECRSRVMMVQGVRLGFVKVIVIVVATP
jgi:hypothetical protein